MESSLPLKTRLASRFGRAEQRKGEKYCFHDDCVSDLRIHSNRVAGVVYGSRAYDVELYYSMKAGVTTITDFECTCPHFAKGYNCKHVWAVILECDFLATQDARWAKFLSGGNVAKDRLGQLLARVNQYSAAVATQPVHRDFLFGDGKSQQERLAFVFDVSEDRDCIKLLVFRQKQKLNGDFGVPQRFKFEKSDIESAPAQSRQLLRALTGYEAPSVAVSGYGRYSYQMPDKYESFDVRAEWSADVWKLLAQTKQTFWSLDPNDSFEAWQPVTIDVDRSYSLRLKYDEKLKTKTKVLVEVSTGESTIPNDQIVRSGSGVCVAVDRLFKIDNPELLPLLDCVLQDELVILKKDRAKFVELLDRIPNADQLPLPESWGIEKAAIDPVVGVEFHQGMRSKYVWARVFFEYGKETFSWGTHEQARFDGGKKSLTVRSLTQEQDRLQQLLDTGIPVEPAEDTADASFRIAANDFVPLASALAPLGWKVLWKGKPLRVATGVTATVGGEHDWFNLDAKVQFSGATIPLPQVLAALKRKEEYVTLHDGTLGHIPQGMLDRYAKIAQFGEIHDDTIRFQPSQAMILDAMLESQPGIELGKRFKNFRKKIQQFDGVKSVKTPVGFKGKLRPYQNDGLAWLHFLQEFNLGGCLADDMGLGKTVQVLALLEKRRTRRIVKAKTIDSSVTMKALDNDLVEALGIAKDVDPWCQAVNQSKRKPTIVVVPKSLIFNWIEEANKFAPKLRILNYTGTDRKLIADEFGDFDILLTTYATMRIDIQRLSQIEFDYAILDESQAIKNSSALVAKASRLLRSDFRLAMTGTPIENHLGELWSLFEFLNPGMLGNLSGFKAMTRIRPDDKNDHRAIEALAAGLKPFFLRRTKTQVLKELPAKTEQLLTCEMTKLQRKQYDELKKYYQVKLKKKVETEGLGKSKIHVLEALLRLRQVACDPRLVDPAAKPGAKLELLQQQLEEVVSGGSKALVFSQFTSLLGLLKDQLDAAGICYEYLDGKTTKRAAKVKNFQENDDVKVFLISLKAGGSGLNLTAAQYVYLLDPWWNPAVEAQAIDRAHRMGQKDKVFAYRMTCKDSVEDKILKMQSSKKKLAESVINADDSLLRNLNSDDLALLLS